MRLSTRLTPRGVALVAVGIALVALAWAVGLPDFAVPGLVLGVLPLGSLAAVAAFRPRFALTRTLPTPVVGVGEDATVHLAVTVIRGGIPGGVVCEDDPPRAVGGSHQFRLEVASRGAVTRTWYERRPQRRGRHVLDQCWLRFADPLELAENTLRLSGSATLMVTPRTLPLPPFPGRTFGRSGETPFPQTALSGPDDVLVRDYQPRDDVRRVHWPATARTGTLMVRREEAAWDPTAWVLLDSRAPAHRGPSTGFEWLVTCAASMGASLLGDGYEVALVDAAGRTHTTSPRGAGARADWLEALVDVDLADESSLAAATRTVVLAPTGHVIIALLGALDPDTARSLVSTHDSRQQCRAFVLPSPPDGQAADEAGRTILSDHGWVVVTLAPDDDLAAIWGLP